MILDEEDQIIYATPMEGSELAGLVNDPLPIEFIVSENESTLVTPQVLAVESTDTPESFGFASFGFEVVEPRIKEIQYYDGAISRFIYEYQHGKIISSIYEYCYPDLASCMQTGSESFEYDNYGRVIKYSYEDTNTPLTTITLTYNNAGKIAFYFILDWQYEFIYEDDGILTSVERTRIGVQNIMTLVYYSWNENQVTLSYFDNLGVKQTERIFTLDDKTNPRTDYLDPFTLPFAEHNVIEEEWRAYDEDGISVVFQCKSTIAFEYDLQGYPTKAVYSDPDFCMANFYNGTEITFIYK